MQEKPQQKRIRYRKTILAALIGGLLGFPAMPASAQTNLDIVGYGQMGLTLPGRSIVGRLATSPGQAQAITMAQLAAQIIGNSGGAILPNIVIIGDSLSAQNSILHEAWPSIFQRYMSALGMPINVTNLALDACSFYRANNATAGFTFNGLTPVQYAVTLKPTIVIVMLGFNDAIVHVDSRSHAQNITDAAAVFSALQSGLPAAQIVYASEVPYDITNFTDPTFVSPALVNYGVVPYSFTLDSTAAHQLYNCYCSEMLPNAVGTDTHGNAVITDYSNWVSFDASIKALSGIGSLNVNYWRICRMGAIISPDFIHPNELGSILECGYIMKGIRTQSWFASLFPNAVANNTAQWNDPDTLFSAVLTASGTAWVNAFTSLGESVILDSGLGRQMHPDTWYLPYHSKFSLSPLAGPNDDETFFSWNLQFGPPSQTMYISIDGATQTDWASYGNASTAEGQLQAIGDFGGSILTAAAHTIRYRMQIPGTSLYEVYGPFTFTPSAAAVPYMKARLTANLTLTSGAAFTLINYDTVDNDNVSAMASGVYTVKKKGKYQVNATLTVSGLTPADWCQCMIYKNSARFADGALGYNATASNSPGYGASMCSHVIDCAVGDTIKIYGYNAGSTSPPAVPGAANTSTIATIKWVGY